MPDDPVEIAQEGQERNLGYTTPRTKRGSAKDRLQKIKSEGVKGLFDSYKRGGKVRKTGLAYVHKGETVVPKRRKGKARSNGKRR